ncbi:GNAT family N-acetyltransferase [soil metagenome]
MSDNPDHPDETILVVDAPEHGRFEISVDAMAAGFTEYVDEETDSGTVRTFPHTVIDEEYAGRGLATVLIATALDSSRAKRQQVVPTCSAVRHFITKHPEYADLVPADRRAELGL